MRDLIIYLGMCSISILTGQGILRLLGVQIERRISLYLAPVITLTFWAILLGLGVSFGLPVKYLWLTIWGLTVLTALNGFRRVDYQCLRSEWAIATAVMLLPIALMAPYFWHGLTLYLGSLHPDGWSYIAYGQYLWEYPRGAEGDLMPLYQYAAHLSRTRFISAALLGLFSPLVGFGGDTQSASGYFLAWALFVFSSTCMFFAVVKSFTRGLRLFYVGMSFFSGWLVSLLLFNNYDTVLAISFLPAFAGIIDIVDPNDRRWAVVLGALGAGILYCYPEMAMFVVGGACLFILQRVLSRGQALRKWMILLVCSAGLAGVLVAPFARDMRWFIANQLHGATSPKGARPGEGLAGELMIAKYRLPAFWGFSMDALADRRSISNIWKAGQKFVALAFSILAVLGIWALCRRQQWGLAATIVLLFIGSLIMILHVAYSYGAYKFILLDWWGISAAVVVGIDLLLVLFPSKRYRWYVSICSGSLLLLFLFYNGTRILSSDKALSVKSISPFKRLEEVKNIVDGNAVIIAIKNDIAYEWAVYFLREIPIYSAEYRAYMSMPHVVPFMERSKAISISDVRYILTDSIGSLSSAESRLLWSAGPYYLWKMPADSWIILSDIANANGVEDWGGDSGFWLGRGDTEIRLLSGRAGQAAISAHLLRGPSLPDKRDRTTLIFTDRGHNSIMTISEDGPLTFSVSVVAGRNRVILRPFDQPTLAVTPDGDSRPLLLGVRGLKVSLGQ